MRPSRGSQNKRARGSGAVVTHASSHSESDEEEIDEVSEIESLREEIRDMKISISCIRTGQQEHLGRLAGLERHVMDALSEVTG